MAILLITPKDITDCNQLVALLHSNNMRCMNSEPQTIRVGTVVKTWTWEDGFDAEYYIPSTASIAYVLAEHGGNVQQLSVNELAKELATL